MNEIKASLGPFRNNHVFHEDQSLYSSYDPKENTTMTTKRNQKTAELPCSPEDFRHNSLLTLLEQLTERHKMKEYIRQKGHKQA